MFFVRRNGEMKKKNQEGRRRWIVLVEEEKLMKMKQKGKKGETKKWGTNISAPKLKFSQPKKEKVKKEDDEISFGMY